MSQINHNNLTKFVYENENNHSQSFFYNENGEIIEENNNATIISNNFREKNYIAPFASERFQTRYYNDLKKYILVNKEDINKIIETNKKAKLSEFVNRIETNYFDKSQKALENFYKLLAFMKNKTTKEFVFNVIDTKNRAINIPHLQDFRVNTLTNQVEVKEQIKGITLQNKDNLYAQKVMAKVKYIEVINENRNKVFLTLTLPSNHHKYTLKPHLRGKKNKQKISYQEDKNFSFNLNPHFEFNHISYEEHIENDIELLNVIYRDFYRYFQVYLKNYYKAQGKTKQEIKELISFDKIKMVEPHTSFTPHLHFLWFIEDTKEVLDLIKSVFKMIIKKYNLNEEFCDFEEVRSAKASTYVAKYITKNTKEEQNKVNHFRHYFSNKRIFTLSNFRKTTMQEVNFVYKYLNKNNPQYLKQLKTNNIPIYLQIENLIDQGHFIFLKEKVERKAINYKKYSNKIKETSFEEPKKILLEELKEKQYMFQKKEYKVLNEIIDIIDKNIVSKLPQSILENSFENKRIKQELENLALYLVETFFNQEVKILVNKEKKYVRREEVLEEDKYLTYNTILSFLLYEVFIYIDNSKMFLKETKDILLELYKNMFLKQDKYELLQYNHNDNTIYFIEKDNEVSFLLSNATKPRETLAKQSLLIIEKELLNNFVDKNKDFIGEMLFAKELSKKEQVLNEITTTNKLKKITNALYVSAYDIETREATHYIELYKCDNTQQVKVNLQDYKQFLGQRYQEEDFILNKIEQRYPDIF